jgi:hypothetical protein
MPVQRRQALFTSAIDHLSRSTALVESSLTSYHLAHLYAITGQLDKATEAIRTCLESEDSANLTDDPTRAVAEGTDDMQSAPEGVAAWHLLALLRSADRDWDGALRACDAGIGAWEEGEDIWESKERALQPDARTGGLTTSTTPSRKGSIAPSIAMSAAPSPAKIKGMSGSDRVASKDFGITSSFSTLALNDQSPSSHVAQERRPSLASIPDKDWRSLIDEDGHLVPSSSAARMPNGSIAAQSPYQTRRERLQDVIALRQTAIIIAEKRDGAEVALEQQKELFGFYKAKSVPSRSASAAHAGGSRRQRSGSGTMGTMHTMGTAEAGAGSASDAAYGRSKSNSLASVVTGQPQQGLALVAAVPAGTGVPGSAGGEGSRGIGDMVGEDEGRVETLEEEKGGNMGESYQFEI